MANTVFYNQVLDPHLKRPHEMLILIVCRSWGLSTQISQNSWVTNSAFCKYTCKFGNSNTVPINISVCFVYSM